MKPVPIVVLVHFLYLLPMVLSGCHSSASSGPQRGAARPAGTNATLSRSWVNLFDGKTLRGWKVTDFAGTGEVRVEKPFRGGDAALVLGFGYMTGISWTNDLPHRDYELELEAMRVDGSDFFCGLTFPVGDSSCSLIVGGWGGGVVGLSSIDGQDAANNETTKYKRFENERWYKIQLRVTADRIDAWIDGEHLVDVSIAGRKLSVRIEVEASKPLGVASWSTTAALRNLRIRRLPNQET